MKILDEAVLRQLRDDLGDDAALQHMLGMFRQNAPRLVADAQGALARGDPEGWRRAAHTLGTSAGLVGAQALMALAREAERAAPDAGRARAMEAALAQALAALASYE